MSDRLKSEGGVITVWSLEVQVPGGTTARLSALAQAGSASVEELRRRALFEGAAALRDDVAAAWIAWTANRSPPPTYALPTSPKDPETIWVAVPANSVGAMHDATATCAIHLRNMHRGVAPDIHVLSWQLRGPALVRGVELLEAEARTRVV